jgi:hypothetical protein
MAAISSAQRKAFISVVAKAYESESSAAAGESGIASGVAICSPVEISAKISSSAAA